MMKKAELSPFRKVRSLVKHMVIIFWGVSLIPFYMAWVFASHELFIYPSWESDFMNFFLGLLVVGPFLGGSTLLFNDYWDYEVDKISQRKSNFPLPKGILSRSIVLKLSISLMIIAIGISLYISLLFALIITTCIILSILYSAPPLRIKGRAGWDVLLNATGAGILCSLAGWVVAGEPLGEFPFLWLVTMFTGVAAIYIPTTIIDHDSDRMEGISTIAVRFGKKKAFHLGLVCIAIANLTVIIMTLIDYLISPEVIPLVWPVAFSQVGFYWLSLRVQTYKNVYITIGGLATLLAVGNVIILFHYTGNLEP